MSFGSISVLFVLIFLTCLAANAQRFDYPIANLSSSWSNNDISITHHVQFADGSMVRSILLKQRPVNFGVGQAFACGFYCNGNCTSFLFGVFIVYTNSGGLITMSSSSFPKLVWSANSNHPVRQNATVELTQNGDLVLKDVDGTVVWSTKTNGRSVVSLQMTDTGNLVLLDKNKKPVWQSFEHPTDSLLPGQKIMEGQKLTAGLFSLSVTKEGLFAYVGSNPTQFYYQHKITGIKKTNNLSYVRFLNGSLSFFIVNSEPNAPDDVISVPFAPSVQYMQLGSDGHLRVFHWTDKWIEVADLLTGYYGECNYPMVCGKYGICTNGQCSCPVNIGRSLFKPVNARKPNLGCYPVTPLSCAASQNHRLIEVQDINYFYYPDKSVFLSIESCKKACLRSCSCKAAMHRGDALRGECFLVPEVFSMMDNDKDKTHYNGTAFLKVQLPKVK